MALAELIDASLGLGDHIACRVLDAANALWCGTVVLGERLFAFYAALLGPWFPVP